MTTETDCANPLLLKWLEEWLQNARDHNSKGVQTYKKAYDSMKACPLTFDHPSEAQQLHGLGPKLCDRLTAKLREHCLEHGLPMPDVSHAAPKRQNGDDSAAGLAKKPRKPKPYVPVFRSGPHAILLALSSVDEDVSRGFTKNEIIELAQPHCDSSFTAPSDPTKFVTAWNSIKTLIEKDLVFERGRPLRKYALTEDGWEVANRMRTTSHVNDSIAGFFANASSKAGTAGLIDKTLKKTDDIQGVWDVDRVKNSGLPSGAEESLNDVQAKSTESSSEPRTSAAQITKPLNKESSTFEDDEFVALSSSSPPQPTTAHPRSRQEIVSHQVESMMPDTVKHTQCSRTHESAVISEPSFPPAFQPLLLHPPDFSVHLVLDTREVRAKQDRDYIQDELTKKGVKPIMRSLELGDAMWVARRQNATNSTLQPEETDEVMLDWIVERKRLDDLIGSIKDGRFHEQKFRLQRSGIKNVIYIIEDISMSTDTMSKYQEAVESAIASTQIVNSYFLKMTAKVDDTIRYLARMTVLLKSIYERQTLNIIPTSVLTPQNYLPLLAHLQKSHPTTDYQITYSAFASLASKSESLTLRDVYLKMLMCTKGLTGDKALEVQKKWPTPRELVEAFEQCGKHEAGRQRQQTLLVDELSRLIGRKKIGKALSVKVAEVWGCS